ncbi:hypothetical protein IQ268_01400 [Oculatella sp. LEGE 06141]|uniref:hypothetical protein n=1 Tax=Oculatella sp. LEGE 06141 TaxID=1828648 RepID=UPI001880C65F|nr:hypothetical protein [Oculatella sp. LEGE 06141]MBE9177228.1 hypothetical protein [Oculatella sp. LEGE 06141]
MLQQTSPLNVLYRAIAALDLTYLSRQFLQSLRNTSNRVELGIEARRVRLSVVQANAGGSYRKSAVDKVAKTV